MEYIGKSIEGIRKSVEGIRKSVEGKEWGKILRIEWKILRRG